MIRFKKGFTLVELLVVMSILGVLISLVAGNFRSSQIKGRDAQRKSDLKQISTALELFYADYNYYPPSEDGYIMACFFEEGVGGSRCSWGTGSEFKDVYPGTTTSRTIYFKSIPSDPSSKLQYYYRTLENNRKFQLFATLENSEDPDCLGGDCINSPVEYECGTKICNFAITSSNTSYDE